MIWLPALMLPLLMFSSCSDSEDSPKSPDNPAEVTDTVTQKVKAVESHVDVIADESLTHVYVKAYKGLKSTPKLTIDSTWVRVKSTSLSDTEDDEGFKGLFYLLEVDENKGLGRTADITITYEDNKGKAGTPVHVTLHQYPRKLNKTEEITVEHPGDLRLLLGSDASAWSNMNTLKLSGKLNTSDMRSLRLLLKREVRSIITTVTLNGMIEYSFASTMNLRHLDMGNCQLVENGDTAIEAGIEDPDYSYKQQDNVLGEKAFFSHGCKLESIVLPKGLTEIGRRAFYMCGNLTSIDIPASVKKIDSYAFFNCGQLSAINIPDDSQLESIGMYALDTGARLKSISFPASLNVEEREGILGRVSADNIHVRWTTPPALKRYHISKNATLWVPKGTAEAYKAIEGWSTAKEIKEPEFGIRKVP